jgi:hypothetical protein
MPHKLEELLNAPANDIMEALLHGFRAQVDVKGKLAELYLYAQLKELEQAGIIKNLGWIDKDGVPDFIFEYKSKPFHIECKNVRNTLFNNPKAFKVEIQKTRNSKYGSNTRSYHTDHFDILAVCTFNQTKRWEYLFIKSNDLEVVESDPNLLKIFQRVPINPEGPWKINILDVLN